MARSAAVLIACALAGCYQPVADLACTLSCKTDACPAPLQCSTTDFVCYDPSVGQCSQVSGTCFGSGANQVCPTTVATSPLVLEGILDTGASSMCGGYSSPVSLDACVIAAADISVGLLDVTGPRPLVLVASSLIEVDGTLDASSALRLGDGPGANSADCPPPSLPMLGSRTGGGGAGGSFGGKGGPGSAGGLPSTTGSAGAGGISADVSVPTRLRGGCAGSPGAGSQTDNGAGGSGGGAVMLIASTVIVNGTIDASGSGGEGGQATGAGAGGGGSGGMIVIEASTLAIGSAPGTVMANGGGGGEGAGSSFGATSIGMDGQDPSMPTSPAIGGSGSTGGGNGGAGSFGVTLDGTAGLSSQTDDGGGGGGGGAGVIQLHAKQLTGPTTNVSPPRS